MITMPCGYGYQKKTHHHSKRSAQVSSKKVGITNTADGFALQAGLIPVCVFSYRNSTVLMIYDIPLPMSVSPTPFVTE
jgi:hypothetical protein